MSSTSPPLPGIDEVRQANRLFLEFLRARPALAAGQFGLPPRASELLALASEQQIGRAADFPGALFRLGLPAPGAGRVGDPLGLAGDPGEHTLKLMLLHSARTLCRTSAYSARLLLRLADEEIEALRRAELRDILWFAQADGVLRVAFDDPDWIWPGLLTESRPEQRRSLFLIGLQPDSRLQQLAGLA